MWKGKKVSRIALLVNHFDFFPYRDLKGGSVDHVVDSVVLGQLARELLFISLC